MTQTSAKDHQLTQGWKTHNNDNNDNISVKEYMKLRKIERSGKRNCENVAP